MALLNDLLDLSKLEAGKTDYSMREGSLADVAKSVASELNAFAEERGMSIVIASPSAELLSIFDADRMMQVLRNLLSNAIKFSEKGCAIRVELELKSEISHCRIINRGIGIPDSELESIFDKFVQSSKTRTGAGGTGLGLAICREIVRQHSGKIWAESRSDETVFTIEMPVKQGV